MVGASLSALLLAVMLSIGDQKEEAAAPPISISSCGGGKGLLFHDDTVASLLKCGCPLPSHRAVTSSNHVELRVDKLKNLIIKSCWVKWSNAVEPNSLIRSLILLG